MRLTSSTINVQSTTIILLKRVNFVHDKVEKGKKFHIPYNLLFIFHRRGMCFLSVLEVQRSVASWISLILACMGNCLGCCMSSPHVISADKPSKGVKVPRKRLRKTSLRDDFWSSSACEMENSTFPSQRSISSISTSNQALDLHSNSGTTNNTSEFVNLGLLLWNQTRQQWCGNKTLQKRASVREPKLSLDTSYKTLVGTNKIFPQAIPLPEMVDFLVDVWEQEGLYD
ncbi:hypothetical protein K7X08_004298 [Anisodus acutangulus]|uniref:Gag1-like clamp domain-containing protein n=1 Tax=Anisodus acutangulus TaxID=402998 RepID=A0A9Q1MH11_9SOLA|nr:hypothetical protein K7X08_004298 [Anisodus acutangulus]